MSSSALPDLGRRGEGWFVVQVLIFAVIAAAGLAGPSWAGPGRVFTDATGVAMIIAGGIFATRAVIDLGRSLTVFPRPLPNAELVRSGAYRLARHPIYGGLILGAVGWGLVTASPPALAAAVGLGVFFDLKSRREEAWLETEFPEYEDYRGRTSRLLPWIH